MSSGHHASQGPSLPWTLEGGPPPKLNMDKTGSVTAGSSNSTPYNGAFPNFLPHLDMCEMAILQCPVVTHQVAQARACSWPEVWGRVSWFPFYCTRLVPSPSVCIREAPATNTVMLYSAHVGICVYMHVHVCLCTGACTHGFLVSPSLLGISLIQQYHL